MIFSSFQLSLVLINSIFLYRLGGGGGGYDRGGYDRGGYDQGGGYGGGGMFRDSES